MLARAMDISEKTIIAKVIGMEGRRLEDAISFQDFLLQSQIGEEALVKGAWETYHNSRDPYVWKPLYLDLYCEFCEIQTTFIELPKQPVSERNGQTQFKAMPFFCRGCRKGSRTFSFHFRSELFVIDNKGRLTLPVVGAFLTSAVHEVAVMTMMAVYPRSNPKLSSRQRAIIGSAMDLYQKGLVCEDQGFGIAAYAYYRRIVELRKNELIDAISKVASSSGDIDQDVSQLLVAARSESQFTKSLSMIASAIPRSLFISGQNPLTLLHSVISNGVHDLSDAECLDDAHTVRTVLLALLTRLAELTRDNKDLDEAVRSLARRREASRTNR